MRGSSDPYRTSDEEAVEARALPQEFLYVTGGVAGGRSLLRSPRALLLLFALLIVGALAVGRTNAAPDDPLRMILGPLMIGLVALLVVMALFDRIPTRATVQPAKKQMPAGLLLRVVEGDLEIASTATPKKPVLRARLRDVRDVRLDTRQIRKVESTPEAGGQFMSHQVGPEIDVARIQLLIDGRDRPIPLTEAFGAHMDAMEWMGKIRTFLRANDWLPEDERTRIPMDSEDDDDELELAQEQEHEQEQGPEAEKAHLSARED